MGSPPPAVPFSVLVIDDEKNIRTTLSVCLEGQASDVVAVPSGEAALAAVGRQPFDLAFLDLRLGSESGMNLIPRLLAESPGLLIVVVTAYATFETAVEAMRGGAWDYLPKPFTPHQIRHLVDKAMERRQLSWRVQALEQDLGNALPEVDLSSRVPAMRAAYDTLARAAAVDVPVLIRGETGTGKTVAARALHAQSGRAQRPFVVVNCPTLSEELLASELFGHARGAFTGAVKDQPGRVETAHGGTLFLDEIGEIPPPLQAKLLRFLQEKQFERVGEVRTRRADVRVVAATNRDLEVDVQSGRFRQDLLFRLNVIEVTLPPLRDRPDDVIPLARRFLGFYARQFGRPAAGLSSAAESVLRTYAWPGNVRELQNTIERALILWPGQVIEPDAFPSKIHGRSASSGPQIGGEHSLAEIETAHLQAVLSRSPSLDEAAHTLGIDASTLWRKRKKLDDGEG